MHVSTKTAQLELKNWSAWLYGSKHVHVSSFRQYGKNESKKSIKSSNLWFLTQYPKIVSVGCFCSFSLAVVVGNIPGTIQGKFRDTVTYSKPKQLERVRVSGYEFKGWYDENGKEYTNVDKDITLYAKLIRKDHYDYWEKEEPKIRKVDNPNWKKVDPA